MAGVLDEAHLASVIVSIFLCCIGLVGNLIVGLLILLSRDFRKSTHSWYILQISIANTLFLITLPFGVVEKLNGDWPYSTAVCKAKETVLFLNYYASIIFLTILSVDRYVSVRKGFVRGNNSRRWILSWILTALTWMISLAMCVPIILYSGKFLSGGKGCVCGYEFPNPERLTGKDFCLENNYTAPEEIEDCLTWAPQPGKLSCHTNDGDETTMDFVELNFTGDYYEFEDIFSGMEVDDFSDILAIDCHYHAEGSPLKIFLYANFVIMFLIPFAIIFVSYTAIAVRMRGHDSTTIVSDGEISPPCATASSSSPSDKTLTQHLASGTRSRHGRVTLLCVLYVVTFVVCWLPFHASHLAKIAGIRAHHESNLCRNLSIGSSLLAYAHAALNPLLYIFAIGRKRIKRAFGIGKRRVIWATTAITKTIGGSSSLSHRDQKIARPIVQPTTIENKPRESPLQDVTKLPETETTVL